MHQKGFQLNHHSLSISPTDAPVHRMRRSMSATGQASVKTIVNARRELNPDSTIRRSSNIPITKPYTPSAKKCARKRTELKMVWTARRVHHFPSCEIAIHDAIPHKATP